MIIIEKILALILHLMYGYFSLKRIHYYERWHRAEKKKQTCNKIKAILSLDRVFSHSEVAGILLIDRDHFIFLSLCMNFLMKRR